MNNIETHIEKKIPFMYETKEGEQVVVFPAEKRFSTEKASVVMKSEAAFESEIEKVKTEAKNFQSLRPARA